MLQSSPRRAALLQPLVGLKENECGYELGEIRQKRIRFRGMNITRKRLSIILMKDIMKSAIFIFIIYYFIISYYFIKQKIISIYDNFYLYRADYDYNLSL